MTRQIGVLIYPDFQLLDATGPISTFELATRFAPDAYRIRLFAEEPGLVKSSSRRRPAGRTLAQQASRYPRRGWR